MRDPLEQYVIDRIREKRIKLKISQMKLAHAFEYESVSYIGAIESMNPKRTETYNIKQIHIIANLFKCAVSDFFPAQYPFSYISEREHKNKSNKR
ncbi:MAG: hypothetical protein DI598_19315 [Pseudopedobacter saltans]|uniref:HTH cro/C1-type domain-containing protein n=1 Tax=Pseudopedobacter saltans TaxID=151895 RepID=A0A2W5GED6_9SPHI|nr:MAG: hypothetical protein DI598_19315 [Pseudopedobacter saltans]